MSGSVGYLGISGVELANNARTIAYLDRGLAGDRFEVFDATCCAVLATDAWPDPAGTLYPHDGLWPSDDLYPALYGVFLDPGSDGAPWTDADRPESYGFLGMIVTKIDGLDGTSTRTVEAAADGIGGIVGPEVLAPRDLVVSGILVSTDCAAMEYARRWLADALNGGLCPDCSDAYLDVRTFCPDLATQPASAGKWRIYGAAVAEITTPISAGEWTCFAQDVEIRLVAADPYLYSEPVVGATTTLNAGPDAPPVAFDAWLFDAPTSVCATITDAGIGTDAAIFTFYGGSSGIEWGMAAQSYGAYPSSSLFPSACVYPCGGAEQWSNDDCPFVFNLSIAAGEYLVVDSARRRVDWVLADGTILDGSPKLHLAPGDVVGWVDTCDGVTIDACAQAFASCSCDSTATVTISTIHRER